MRVYVPTTGDRLKLTADWIFTLYNDHENWYFLDAMNLRHIRMQQCTLPAGTVLRVARFDVHGDRCHCDRVIFSLRGKKVEFWVKLSDIRVLECHFLRPTKKPVRVGGPWPDDDWFDSQSAWDEEELNYWLDAYDDEDEDDEGIPDEEWDDQEDGWDDSFQPTLTY